MTEQEIFDKVVAHLLRQGARAQKINRRGCLYLADNGKRCAVGCLLSDEAARAGDRLSDNTVEGLANEGLLPSDLVPHLALLRELQRIHDFVAVRDWRGDLAQLAKERGLTLRLEAAQ